MTDAFVALAEGCSRRSALPLELELQAGELNSEGPILKFDYKL